MCRRWCVLVACALLAAVAVAPADAQPLPAASGRVIEAAEGDVVVIPSGARVAVVTRSRVQARLVYVAAQQTLLLLTDPAVGFGAGIPDAKGFRRWQVQSPWPLEPRWEGSATIDEYVLSPCVARHRRAAQPGDSHRPRHNPHRAFEQSTGDVDPASRGHRPHHHGEQQARRRLVRRDRTGMAGRRRERTAAAAWAHADARSGKYRPGRLCINQQQRARRSGSCRRQHPGADENPGRRTRVSAGRARRRRPGCRDPRARHRHGWRRIQRARPPVNPAAGSGGAQCGAAVALRADVAERRTGARRS